MSVLNELLKNPLAVGSTGAALAGIAANHTLTDRTKREKKDTDRQLEAAAVGANVAHLGYEAAKHSLRKMATLNEMIDREKAAQYAFIKGFTKAAMTSAMKSGKTTDEARELSRGALEKSAAFIERQDRITALEAAVKASDPVHTQKLEKLASVGFSEQDVQALEKMNPALLEKVAKVADQPWAFGEPSGQMTKKSGDALMDFILA